MTPLFRYGFSLPGRSHLADGAPCQDAHIMRELPGGWVLAAVADGVGGASHSQLGAEAAVDCMATVCAGEFYLHGDDLTELLRVGFWHAETVLYHTAAALEIPLAAFDTTLTAALYNGRQVVWGHCGDGGIIALEDDGRYRLLTSAQKGEAWNEVVPLRFGPEHWVFHLEQAPAAGLLLLTDGLFDVAMPPLMSGCEPPLYTAFVHRFLNGGLTAAPAEDAAQALREFIQSDACAAVTDDVTAVALLNAERPAAQPPQDYLAEPDWEALRLARYYKLYPHLQPGAEEDVPHDSGKQDE